VDSLDAGQAGYVALAKRLLSRAGGQVSDSGRILNEGSGAVARVDGVARIRPACRAPITCASSPGRCASAISHGGGRRAHEGRDPPAITRRRISCMPRYVRFRTHVKQAARSSHPIGCASTSSTFSPSLGTNSIA